MMDRFIAVSVNSRSSLLYPPPKRVITWSTYILLIRFPAVSHIRIRIVFVPISIEAIRMNIDLNFLEILIN